jgi:hypothetical protein
VGALGEVPGWEFLGDWSDPKKTNPPKLMGDHPWWLLWNYIVLGKFHHDLTVLPNPGIMVKKRNYPKMAQLFRLVNYYNLPRLLKWNKSTEPMPGHFFAAWSPGWPSHGEFGNAETPRFPMMATIDITKLSAKVLDYTDAEDGTDLKVMFSSVKSPPLPGKSCSRL